MTFHRLSIPAVLSFVALTACSASSDAPGDDGASQAIVGGRRDASDPAVVMLAQVTSEGVATCTATFISTTVLLTAAHCVVGENDPKNIPADATFKVLMASSEDSASHSDYVPIDIANVHFHPGYDGEAQHDVAVLVLDTPQSVTPMPIRREPLGTEFEGQKVRLVGYGITRNKGGGSGTKRAVTTTFRGQQDGLLLIGDTGRQACEGDSGGPAFMKIDGVETLVGTDDLAATDQDCKGGDLYQPVDQQLDFIDSYLNGDGAAGKGESDPSGNSQRGRDNGGESESP